MAAMEIKPIPPFEEPLEVTVVEGEVVILGPDGIRGSFTPAAARESAERIFAALELI